MNKQQLANRIWESANKMRSKIAADQYKDYILGFMFYKFLSDREVQYLKKQDWTDEYLQYLDESDTETVESIRKNIGYFIPYEHLFSTWIAQGKDFTADKVTVALSSFSRLINSTHEVVFKNIFKTLETGLSSLGETSMARTKAIKGLIDLIKDIPMDGRQDYDVLGFIYEYLIGNFAANAGKKAGEFYTPHEVSLLMSEIVANHLKDRKEIKIYDPTSGSGSLLINIGKCVAKYMDSEDNIKYYAQELKENTYNLTRMNLVMRGILPDNIITRNGDTLEEDWPYFDDSDPVNTYNPLYVDAVVSNPPYSQAWDPTDKQDEPRYSRYGLAPKGKADYAFLLHDLFHLKSDGIMAIVLPHGVLFRGGEEGEIRKNLIEFNNIDTIIGLPANIFFGTGIPTIIMILKQKRENTDVLIIDASKGFAKVGKNNVLRACDIKKIVDTVKSRTDEAGYAKVVTRDEIRQNDYNLNIPRYVDSSEKAESWDIYASMFGGIPENELQELEVYWQAFPNIKKDLFTQVNAEYWEPKVEDIKAACTRHADVISFKDGFFNAFADFGDYLAHELIDNAVEVDAVKEVSVISEDIFQRLKNVPLVDKYEAYQLLDDDWKQIAIDLEIIQSEGFDAVKQVDPNYIIKKKNNVDEEVQDGWRGHILPFALVQSELLGVQLDALKNKENRLAEITGEYDTMLEELSEEDKEQDFVNEAKDAFVPAEVKKAIKAKVVEDSVLEVLKKVQRLVDEEKNLKKAVKEEREALHLLTKKTIESLDDGQAQKLLRIKWIDQLVVSIHGLPDTVIKNFVAKLEALCSKYAVTFADIEKEIAETEDSLSTMLDELEGSEFDMKAIAELKALLGGE